MALLDSSNKAIVANSKKKAIWPFCQSLGLALNVCIWSKILGFFLHNFEFIGKLFIKFLVIASILLGFSLSKFALNL